MNKHRALERWSQMLQQLVLIHNGAARVIELIVATYCQSEIHGYVVPTEKFLDLVDLFLDAHAR